MRVQDTLCLTLQYSSGAADVELDDAWGSDTFDSSDSTIPKQIAEEQDDLPAASKAKAQSTPVKPKVNIVLGTGTLSIACKTAAKISSSLTHA